MNCLMDDIYQRAERKSTLTLYQSLNFSVPGFIMKYPTFNNLETNKYTINKLGMSDDYLKNNREKLTFLYSRSYILICFNINHDYYKKTIGTLVQLRASSIKKQIILTNYSLIKQCIDMNPVGNFNIYMIDPLSITINLQIILEELDYIFKIVFNEKEKETRLKKFVEEYQLEKLIVDNEFCFIRNKISSEYIDNDIQLDFRKKKIMPYMDILALTPFDKFQTINNHIKIELNQLAYSSLSSNLPNENEKAIITISHIPVNHLYRNIEKSISISELSYYSKILFNEQMLSASIGMISTKIQSNNNFGYGNYYQSNYLPGGLLYNTETLSPIGITFIQNNYEDYSSSQYANIYIPFNSNRCLKLFKEYLAKYDDTLTNIIHSKKNNNLFLTTLTTLNSNNNNIIPNLKSKEINICSFIAKEPNEKTNIQKDSLQINNNNIFSFYSQISAVTPPISNYDIISHNNTNKSTHKRILINSTPSEEEYYQMTEKLKSKIKKNNFSTDPLNKLMKEKETLKETILNSIDKAIDKLLPSIQTQQ